MNGVYRFDDFTFDATTGDLSRDNGARTRLAPQPARLLAMLLERRGELLSHDEIRAALWPDVEVEYDQGVHFCVRQIRSALGDSGTSPRYVRTLPRRGYQWMTDVSSLLSSSDGDGSPATTKTPPRRGLRWSRAAALLAVLLAAWFATASLRNGPRPRIAIMPFVPPAGSGLPESTSEIATHLVAIMTERTGCDIIGPTTTEQFAAGPTPIRDAVAELRVDYLINGRFAERDGRVQLLAEFIHADGGAHAWVQWFDGQADPREVAEIIAAAAVERIATE